MGVTFVISYTLIDHYIFSKQVMKYAMEDMSNTLLERERFLNNSLEKTVKQLYSIRQNKLFSQYIQNKTDHNIKLNLSYLFETVIASDQDIMQIRYIDKEGKEKIRFDRKDYRDKEYFQAEKLQDKSSRYYFQNSIDKIEKVWFSKLDLNIENGKVEVPFRSTFRTILPIQYHNNFDGILIINYFAKPLLQRLFDTANYDSILIDNDGYIINHFDPSKSWSRYQKKSFKFDTQNKDPNSVKRELILPFANKLTLILRLKQKFLDKRHDFYINRALVIIITFTIVVFFISALIFILLKYLTNQNVTLEILTKEKKEQNKLMIQNTKMAAMGEMISNIAHQWRQPLNLVSMYCISLERKFQKGDLDEKYFEDFVQKINKTVGQMSDTIDDFSNFFKPNKQRELFDIGPMINEVLNMLGSTLRDNEIMVCFDPQLSYKYNGYKNELKHIIFNLINNSKDAIQINNIQEGKILVTLLEEKNNIIIRIEDNGGGIKPEIIDRVFEPYFTTKHKANGTGIGLYMCKMIIEESLGGTIRIFNHHEGVVNEIVLSIKEN